LPRCGAALFENQQAALTADPSDALSGLRG